MRWVLTGLGLMCWVACSTGDGGVEGQANLGLSEQCVDYCTAAFQAPAHESQLDCAGSVLVASGADVEVLQRCVTPTTPETCMTCIAQIDASGPTCREVYEACFW